MEGEGEIHGIEQGDAKKKEKARSHALCLAHHFRSHLVPQFYMAVELARLGTIVSFVSFEEELSSLAADYKEELRGLDLFRFISVRRDLIALQSPDARTQPLKWVIDVMLTSFKDSQARKALFASMEPPTHLIVDFFLMQSKEVDMAHMGVQIPKYVFFSAGALFPRFNQGLESLFTDRHLRIRDDDDTLEKFDGQFHIDGLPGLSYTDLPLRLRNNPTLLRKFAQALMDADGILMDTFTELEPGMKDVLQKYATRERQKFYAIGPVDPRLRGKGTSAPPDDSAIECLRWLDSQPHESVLYICLGSLFRPQAWQIEELAVGLEISKRRFLWVVPKGLQEDWLPPDFEKRVSDFGYILRGWAPQLEVLSHPSIGAFLSHCGWKSFLEAISRGVALIAYPLDAEQHVNARYFVEVLEVAAEIRRNYDGVAESQSVDAAIRTVMETERGRAMKGRVKVVQASLTAATAANGSSLRERHQFVEDVKAF